MYKHQRAGLARPKKQTTSSPTRRQRHKSTAKTIHRTSSTISNSFRLTTPPHATVKNQSVSDTKKKVASATVKGTKDYFPNATFLYRHIQQRFEEILSTYGYNNEIRTPILETAEVFGATLGADSDVVMKQMYQFDDFGVQTVLRPENTASVVRAVVKRGVNTSSEPNTETVKNDDPADGTAGIQYPDQLYYCGPMFRRERPQNGRLRQFTQFGVENIGSFHPYDDIQVVAMAFDCLRSIGMQDHIILAINSIGTIQERQQYETALGAYLKPFAHLLSTDSRKRYQNGTFLRILDSSDELDLAIVRAGDYLTGNPAILTRLQQRHVNYRDGNDNEDRVINPINPLPEPSTLPTTPTLPTTGAPLLRHHLSDESLDRFNVVLKGLTALNVPYHIDDFLIRGLDYYSHTTFEFLVDQNSTEAIAPSFEQWHLHNDAKEIDASVPFEPLTKETPLNTLPQSSYQAILAGGRYGDIATRFDKYKAGSAALQPLNIGMGWASGLERVILHMERLGLVTEDMITEANKLVDVVVVTMGAKRQLTKAGHKAFLETFQHDGDDDNGDAVGGDDRYNGPLENVSWAFDQRKVEVMQHQVYTHHLIDQYKEAVKGAKKEEEEKGVEGLVNQLKQPPQLPYSPTQVEAVVTDAALVLATKLRRNGKKVLFQPHLTFQKQMAATHGANFAMLIGESEIAHNAVQVKNLRDKTQTMVMMNDIIEYVILDEVREQERLEMEMMKSHGLFRGNNGGNGDNNLGEGDDEDEGGNNDYQK